MKDKELMQAFAYACDYLYLEERQEWQEPDNHYKEYPQEQRSRMLKKLTKDNSRMKGKVKCH